MKKLLLMAFTITALGVNGGFSLPNADVASASAKSTLENLQHAFNGESNAAARYSAFAEKADAEGYKQVAAFFRATAKSEEIHAAEIAKVIKKLQAVPNAVIEKPTVKSTKENLQSALEGETYEKNIMYPAFIKRAKEEKNNNAVRVFSEAMACEIGHAKFAQDALNDLESWKTVSKEFLVCVVCGYVTTDTKIKQCPVCFVPRSKFRTIS